MMMRQPFENLEPFETLRWVGDLNGYLALIDQTLLPGACREWVCRDVAGVWEAIRSLRVRGAPAIGLAAAYGVVLGVRSAPQDSDSGRELTRVTEYLATSRPTAVNLFWALDRMHRRAKELPGAPTPGLLAAELLDLAKQMHREDREICRAIGQQGAELLQRCEGVLTHCNAGGLATSGYGTALAVLYTCQERGVRQQVFVDETRPLLQGARLTAWELARRGIDVTVICDSMAAQVMKEGRIQGVLVGADRIAANGDVANKIGTYGLAVLARAHRIPFYVAAPTSTFDLTLGDGTEIPIEQRESREITRGFGTPTVPDGVRVYNPAFDVTPAEWIDAIITERGVIRPVSAETIAGLVASSAMAPK